MFAPPIDAEAIPFEPLNAAGSTVTAPQVHAEKFLTKLRKRLKRQNDLAPMACLGGQA
jgi:hypothetical protein